MKLLNQKNLTNQLKLTFAKKHFFFDIPLSSQALRFLRIYYLVGIVRRYYRISRNLYRIMPNFSHSKPVLKRIKFFKENTNIRLSLKALKQLNLHSFNSHIILSTSKGILTHKEAIKNTIGGFLICIIY